MMDVFWPALLAGVVMVVVGAVAITKRRSAASGIAEGHRAMFGRAGEKIASQSKPSGVLGAGIGFLVFGVVCIVLGFATSPSDW